MLDDGLLQLKKIHIEYNPANMLTKILPKDKELCRTFGLIYSGVGLIARYRNNSNSIFIQPSIWSQVANMILVYNYDFIFIM